MKLVKIEGESDYAKDQKTGAIVNVNSKKLNDARKAKIERLKKAAEHNAMKSDINELKDELSEIKSVLNKIVEKL